MPMKEEDTNCDSLPLRNNFYRILAAKVSNNMVLKPCPKVHLSPLYGRGWHPERHLLLDLSLETEAWASPLSSSTLRPTTTTRPPPQGSATPATRPAAAHTRREVESFGRRVKEPRRPAGGGVRYRWRWEEHGGGVAGGSRCLAESKPGLSWHWAGPEAGRGSH